VQIEEVDILASGFTGQVFGCKTDRVNASQVEAAATIDLPVISDVVSVTGATQSIGTLRNAWDGRTVVLRGATASHTLQHNNGNILINGNANLTLNSNRGRRLTFSAEANAWYEV
jgi:hypothetical protein